MTSDRMWARDKVAQLTNKEKVGRYLQFPVADWETLLMSVRFHYLPLRTFGGQKRSPQKGFQQPKQAMDQTGLGEKSSWAARR